MPVQKKGNGWRARRKKGSKTFAGPVRATEAAANEDAQLLDTAAAVSMERLEEAHDRLTGVLPGAGAGNDCGDKFVEKSRNGWRARRKIGNKTYRGPGRNTVEAAKEDAQQLEEAAKVSLERLQEVHARMTCVLLASVAKHGSGKLYICVETSLCNSFCV